MNSTISMKLENRSDVRVFEGEANYPEDLFPNFAGLVMIERDEIFRSLNRGAQAFVNFFKEDVWMPAIGRALN